MTDYLALTAALAYNPLFQLFILVLKKNFELFCFFCADHFFFVILEAIRAEG